METRKHKDRHRPLITAKSSRAFVADLVRKIGWERMECLFLDWPHLKRAGDRMARLMGGDLLLSADWAGNLAEACLTDGISAYEAARSDGADTLSAFILAVSQRACDMLQYTVCLREKSAWRRWEPAEDYLWELIEARDISAVRFMAEAHPMRGNRDARVVIASRIFSVADLGRAGVMLRVA